MEYTVYKDQDLKSAKFFYLVSVIEKCNTRAALLNWFTPCQRPTLTEVPDEARGEDVILVSGKYSEVEFFDTLLAVHVPKGKSTLNELDKSDPTNDYYVYGIQVPDKGTGKFVLYKIADDASLPPFRMWDQFMLTEGMIKNYKGEPTKTDVGKFFLNQLLLVYPFGDLIPYKNETFHLSKLDDQIASLILDRKITRSMFNTYMDYVHWFGSDGSIATVTWSEKSLQTDPKIAERKKELFEKYKDQLDDPIVVSHIEQELIAMDKEYLKGDVSEPYYLVGGNKVFNDQRKKMFITFGLSVAFEKNSGSYELVTESLAEGIKPSSMDVIANDVRRGSYGRGVETAKGGEQSKFVLRIFQDVSVDEEDCQSKRGVKVKLDKANKKYYLGRWTVDGKLLDESNIDSFVGKVVEIRSPLYCRTKPGYCYKCVGELFRKLRMQHIGMNEIIITSAFTGIAMKSMHVSGIESTTVSDLEHLLR